MHRHVLLGEVQQETVSYCYFCKKSGHKSGNCYSEKRSVQNRWEIVKDRKLCFNSFKPSNPGHNYRSCRKPSCTAEGCGMKHHRLLHSGTQHN